MTLKAFFVVVFSAFIRLFDVNISLAKMHFPKRAKTKTKVGGS